LSSARPESAKNKNLEFNPRLSPIFPKEFELNKNCSSFKNYTDYENIVNSISSENLASIPDYYKEDVFQSADLDILIRPSKKECLCGSRLVILVKSAISHYSSRERIRKSWFSQPDIALRFVLGIPDPSSAEADLFSSILSESQKWNDLLIGEFKDTYSNLTKKSLTALKWVTEECKNFGHVALVDDDIELDVEKIYLQLQKENQVDNAVHCLHMIQNKARVLRKGKWSVLKEKYPLDFYPQGRDYTLSPPHIFVSS